MQPVIVTAPPSAPLRFPPKLTLGLGLCQLFTGVLCMALNIIAIVVSGPSPTYVAHGIWGGILFIIAGSLEVGASYNREKCLVISTMVMSIIGAVVAMLSVFVVSAISLGVICYDCDGNEDAAIALNSLLLILALLETVVATWTSALCCRAACCCDNPQIGIQGTVMVQYVSTPQQMAGPIMQNGQQVYYAHQVQQPYISPSTSGMQQVQQPHHAPSAPEMPTPPPAYEETVRPMITKARAEYG